MEKNLELLKAAFNNFKEKIRNKKSQKSPVDVPRPRESASDRIEQLRQKPAFLRLKSAFIDAQIDYSETGLSPDSMTIGSLIEVIGFYLECVNASRKDIKYSVEAIVANQIPLEKQPNVSLLIQALTSEDSAVLIDAETYHLPINLEKIVDQDQNDLSHYPGGIMIVEDNDKTKRVFRFLLTNRQQMDNNFPFIAALLKEAGIAVKSNIPTS